MLIFLLEAAAAAHDAESRHLAPSVALEQPMYARVLPLQQPPASDVPWFRFPLLMSMVIDVWNQSPAKI